MLRLTTFLPRATSAPALALAGAFVALSTGCFPDKLVATPCTPRSLVVSSFSGDTVTTATGLRFIEGLVGDGARTGWCRATVIHYDAYVLGGNKFDSTRDAGSPLIMNPGTGVLIDGLEEGVIAMNVGGTRRLIIPPALGFGSEDRRDAAGNVIVPANSTLIYDIEIVEVGQ